MRLATTAQVLSRLKLATHPLSLLQKEPGRVVVVHEAVQPAHEVPHHHNLIVLTQQTLQHSATTLQGSEGKLGPCNPMTPQEESMLFLRPPPSIAYRPSVIRLL